VNVFMLTHPKTVGAKRSPMLQNAYANADTFDMGARNDTPRRVLNSVVTLTGTHDETDGICPPHHAETKDLYTGSDKEKLRRENKARRLGTQMVQETTTLWSETRGDFYIPDDLPTCITHRNRMCPSGLARTHPAGDLLESWAQFGCPTMTGEPWTIDQMTKAVERGPHISATTPEALAHFEQEIAEKVKSGQARTLLWDDIKLNPPQQLKISPIAAIPHKSKPYRSILDLSFSLALQDGTHNKNSSTSSHRSTRTFADTADPCVRRGARG
jgi:hypothetical protein